MKAPYSEFEMQIALIGIEKALKSEENAMKCAERINDMILPLSESKAELNKKVAESNGISVSELIASQNYTTLVDEFKEDHIKKVITMMETDFELTNVQAWAIIYHAAKG